MMKLDNIIIVVFICWIISLLAGCQEKREFRINCSHRTLIAMVVVGEKYRVQAVLGKTVRRGNLHAMLRAEIGEEWVYYSLVKGAIKRVYPVGIVDERILDIDEYLTLVKRIMIYKRKEYVIDQANKQFNGGQ